MNDSVLVVLATFPSPESAREISRILISEHLAACVHLLPAGESIYRWQGAIETANEMLALFKTTATRFPALEARLAELHPYEVPEIIATPVVYGLPGYLQWVCGAVVP